MLLILQRERNHFWLQALILTKAIISKTPLMFMTQLHPYLLVQSRLSNYGLQGSLQQLVEISLSSKSSNYSQFLCQSLSKANKFAQGCKF